MKVDHLELNISLESLHLVAGVAIICMVRRSDIFELTFIHLQGSLGLTGVWWPQAHSQDYICNQVNRFCLHLKPNSKMTFPVAEEP